MLAARRVGLVGKLAPEPITEAGLDAAGVAGNERAEDAASTAAHLAYGAANGVLFVLVSHRLPVPPWGAALRSRRCSCWSATKARFRQPGSCRHCTLTPRAAAGRWSPDTPCTARFWAAWRPDRPNPAVYGRLPR